MSTEVERILQRSIEANRQAREQQSAKLSRLTNALLNPDPEEFHDVVRELTGGLETSGSEPLDESGEDQAVAGSNSSAESGGRGGENSEEQGS